MRSLCLDLLERPLLPAVLQGPASAWRSLCGSSSYVPVTLARPNFYPPTLPWDLSRLPPHGRRARPALARLRPLHGPLGPGPAQARLHTVRPHMATLGPVTHLTSRLLTLRWLGTLRGLSPLSLAARMLLTPLTPLCAVRRSHWAGLLRRRSPHPAHAALLRIPLPTIALACYTALTSPSLRVGPARPGLTADPTLSLSPHTLRWPVPARHSRRALPTPPCCSLPTPCPASAPHRVAYPAQARDRPDPTLTHTQGPARPGPLAPLAPGPPLARSPRSLPARPGPLTSLTHSPGMQVNSTSWRHGARMARFVAPPPALLLRPPRCPHHRARPSPAKGKPVPHIA